MYKLFAEKQKNFNILTKSGIKNNGSKNRAYNERKEKLELKSKKNVNVHY